jgi:uncharacterized membrane protein YuzA (DUF378 family)
METIQKTALVFTIIGAINWGLVGMFNLDLVAAIFGNLSMFSKIIYILIGLCGLINIGLLFRHLESR